MRQMLLYFHFLLGGSPILQMWLTDGCDLKGAESVGCLGQSPGSNYVVLATVCAVPFCSFPFAV